MSTGPPRYLVVYPKPFQFFFKQNDLVAREATRTSKTNALCSAQEIFPKISSPSISPLHGATNTSPRSLPFERLHQRSVKLSLPGTDHAARRPRDENVEPVSTQVSGIYIRTYVDRLSEVVETIQKGFGGILEKVGRARRKTSRGSTLLGSYTLRVRGNIRGKLGS